jgi:hypothetical protein
MEQVLRRHEFALTYLGSDRGGCAGGLFDVRVLNIEKPLLGDCM